MFESIGLGMATEKNKYGTSVKFLGVVIDTVAMRLRIDGLQARTIDTESPPEGRPPAPPPDLST